MADPLPTVPDFGKFTMEEAQSSWDVGITFPARCIDDPAGPASQPSSKSSDPSHVSASVVSSSFDEPSSVPSTVPEGDPEGQPADGSVESGRAERGIQDGIWRLLDGSWHPRNIYNDLDPDYEDLAPSGDDDYGSTAASLPST